MGILPVAFYEQQSTLTLAESLLGCILVKETNDGRCSGMIVETEAYVGPWDQAAHSFESKRTKRTEIMYHSAGHIYTYVMHTHCLVNIVSGEVNAPEAILIRAVEPLEGKGVMRSRREGKNDIQLTNGPGKLTKALGITMNDYGGMVTSPPLIIEEGKVVRKEEINTGPRIGIPNSGDAKHYPWRFWLSGNPYVSK